MKINMKKFGIMISTLVIFVFTIYLAFSWGDSSAFIKQGASLHLSASANISPLLYTGIQAHVFNLFAFVINFLMSIFGDSIMLSIVILALLTEFVLLYPSVRIQIKQKKIHLFHKKLVDRFNKGELSFADTKRELDLLYAVNEKIHTKGALLVCTQIFLMFVVLWGLNLLIRVPHLFHGSWNTLNSLLFSVPVDFMIPVAAGFIYFFHSLVKIYFKEKEDYISPVQLTASVIFTIVISTFVYWCTVILPVALTVYFVTFITFATLRYIIVERNHKLLGKRAQKELVNALKNSKTCHDKFEYFSQKWNHIPIVRYINFHLLEEAVSMSLGLIVAFNFFGILMF